MQSGLEDAVGTVILHIWQGKLIKAGIMMQGMLRSIVVGQYYKDLKNEKYDTSFAVYHRRFSTNTNPRWPLAQPMRVLGHNGALSFSSVTPDLTLGMFHEYFLGLLHKYLLFGHQLRLRMPG